MAVVRSLAQLAVDLRIGDGSEPTGPAAIILERISATARALVVEYVPNAPDSIHTEMFVRMAGYLYDSDPSGSSPGGPAAMRASGAAALAGPYLVRRGGIVGKAVDDAVAAADSGNPVVDVVVDVLAGTLTVTYADGSSRVRPLPTGGDDGGGVDVTARAAAAAAQATADEATTPDEATDLVADFARAVNPSGHLPATRLAENPAEGTVPVVVAGGRAFRFVEIGTLGGEGGADPVARAAAAVAQATADSKDDAYPWATQDDETGIPTAKVDLSGVQAQLDRIVDELAHTSGPITEVIGVLGAGSDSLRYTLANGTAGNFDISVTVTARVQLNEFANFSAGRFGFTKTAGAG